MDRSNTLLIVGVILALLGVAQPFLYATVTVDSTPPTKSASAPVEQGNYGSLSKVVINVRDATSGVATVSFWDDHTGSTVPLALESGTRFDGVWSKAVSTSWPKDTWIGFRFTVTDYHYNFLEYVGNFQILNLDGYWEVTDGTDSFRSDSPDWNDIRFSQGTLTFRFHEDMGDAHVATVTYSGAASGSVDMGRLDMDTWEGSHSFGDGVYNIEMTASDGINAPITASIIQIGAGGGTYNLIQMSLFALGGFMALAGLYIRQQ